MLDLRTPTPDVWLDSVFADLPAFLADHALCEKKAFSTGMALISRYPDEPALVEPLLEFCREELEHFQRMYLVLRAREIALPREAADPYARELRAQVRKGDTELLDRLLVAGVIEARSCERLFMLSSALPARDPELATLYLDLARAESRHHGLFLRLARRFYPDDVTLARASELLEFEAGLVSRLPHRAAVH
jgi:tRNA-(ms[2]io[6]A)-hydroxylase